MSAANPNLATADQGHPLNTRFAPRRAGSGRLHCAPFATSIHPSIMHSSISKRASIAAARGFTLIELMVTLVVLAVLLSLAVPSFKSMLSANRISTRTQDLIDA